MKELSAQQMCVRTAGNTAPHGRPRLKVENPYEYVDCKLLIALWNALSYYPNNVTVCYVRFYLVLEMVRAPSCRWNDPTRYFLAMPNGAAARAPIAPIAHGVRGHRPRDERRHGHDSRQSRRRRSRGVRGGGRRLPRVSRLEQSPTPGRRGGCPGGRRAEGVRERGGHVNS